MTTLIGVELVVLRTQGVWVIQAMTVTKKYGDCLVSDYRSANKQIQKVPGVIQDLEAEMERLLRASASVTSDLLQGYWQYPLAEEAKVVISRLPREGDC